MGKPNRHDDIPGKIMPPRVLRLALVRGLDYATVNLLFNLAAIRFIQGVCHMEPVVVPINGILDLHTFAPGDLDSLMRDYIDACLESAIYDLRVIHGKGKGIMRARVRALLEKDPRVDTIGEAPSDAGGWGATLVRLKRI